MKRFKAIISGVDNFDKPYMRKIEVEGESAKEVYNKIKNQNGVIEIIGFEEI